MRAGRDIFTHVFGRALGEVELIRVIVIAFALWCLDFALIEWRARPHDAVVLALAGLGIIGLILVLRWEPWDLVRFWIAGFVFYLPCGVVSRRQRRGRDAD